MVYHSLPLSRRVASVESEAERARLIADYPQWHFFQRRGLEHAWLKESRDPLVKLEDATVEGLRAQLERYEESERGGNG
jgi:hypothetical protein